MKKSCPLVPPGHPLSAVQPSIREVSHTPTPWITDDRHIHPKSGLAYPRGHEPETDVIVLVDTDCHDNGLLNPTDKANLDFIVRACNSHDDLLSAVHDLLEIVQAEFDDDPEPEDLPSWKRTIDQANAAIAKAEGL